MEDWVVGIDLGATKIALGLVDPQNRVVAQRRAPTAPLEGPAAAVERIAQAVASLKQDLPAGVSLAGVGICSPGPLDHITGTLLDPPNLTGWVNVPVTHAQVPVPSYGCMVAGVYRYGGCMRSIRGLRRTTPGPESALTIQVGIGYDSGIDSRVDRRRCRLESASYFPILAHSACDPRLVSRYA